MVNERSTSKRAEFICPRANLGRKMEEERYCSGVLDFLGLQGTVEIEI